MNPHLTLNDIEEVSLTCGRKAPGCPGQVRTRNCRPVVLNVGGRGNPRCHMS